MWERLNDPEVLARATPGLKELQLLRGDTYKAVFEIKMGPINSTFDGTLQVVGPDPAGAVRAVDQDWR